MVSIKKIIIGKIKAIEHRPLALSLDAGFDRIAGRQFPLQFGERRGQLRIDRRRLDTRNDIGLNGDRRQQVAPPNRRLLELVLDRRDLAQWDRLPVIQRDLQIPQGLL